MQAVILAAGEGIRLSCAEQIPKCLLKVGKQTLLEHTLSQLPVEIKEVIVVVGELKSRIKKQIGLYFGGRSIIYIEQKERLGTGHALFICKDSIAQDERFMVMMGDNFYLKRDMENCLRHPLAILAQRMEAPESFGILIIENGILKEVVENPKLSTGTLVNCGLYVLDKRIFDYPLARLSGGGYGLPQTIVKMAVDHPVTIERANFWLPINTIQDIKRADKYLKKLYL